MKSFMTTLRRQDPCSCCAGNTNGFQRLQPTPRFNKTQWISNVSATSKDKNFFTETLFITWNIEYSKYQQQFFSKRSFIFYQT
ncbi:unnamed protein product, partial [Larinioides sclopetarius]